MRSKFLVALAFAGLSLLSAKSYDIVISSPAQAGTVQLKPGEYKLKIEGSNAVFQDVQTDKTYTTPAKLQTQAKKFDVTAVNSTKADGVEKIVAIELGGSTSEIQFGE